MSIKFFGQFLLERRVLTLDQLRGALALMDIRNVSLEDVAVEKGLLTREQAEQIKVETSETGYSFEELVHEDGLIDDAGLNLLMEMRAARSLRLGEALVELGYITSSRLGDQLAEYDKEQAPFKLGPTELPGKLSSHRPAHVVLDLVPTYLDRVAGVRAKVNYVALSQVPESQTEPIALYVRGASPMRVALSADEALARLIVEGLSGSKQDTTNPEILRDGLLEFLNIVVGNALTILESEGLHLSIVPPEEAGSESEGTSLEVITTVGKAWISVDADPELPARLSGLELQVEEQP